jgi:NADPH:quinone reductase-like Zn-dependent oxidoreductase
MKALTLTAIGGPEHLKLQELPKPSITSPDQVLVRIRAAALNRIDLWVVEGLPGEGPSFPHVVGSDGAGVVEEVGAQVWQVRPGDRVMLNPGLSCGRCPACLESEESLCANYRILG